MRTPSKLTKKNPLTLGFFVLTFSIVFLIEVLFIFQSKDTNWVYLGILIGLYIQGVICNAALSLVTIVSFLFSAIKDPGYLENKDVKFIDLLESVEPTVYLNNSNMQTL
jgi:hypothetical protein